MRDLDRLAWKEQSLNLSNGNQSLWLFIVLTAHWKALKQYTNIKFPLWIQQQTVNPIVIIIIRGQSNKEAMQNQ